MAKETKKGSRFRLLRDVVVFQIKLGMEALLDIMLIPVSLGAAGLDLVLGNWRQPRWFHAVLRFGERCEGWINIWGVAAHGGDAPQSEVDALLRSIEGVIRRPGTGPARLRELRTWAATKIAPKGVGDPQAPERRDDPPG